MTEQKIVRLDVTGRRRDVQIGVHGQEHGDVYLTVTMREARKEAYAGPYEVASVADTQQTLETADRIMTENLVVLPIPYYETSNPKGGLTVYIGGD